MPELAQLGHYVVYSLVDTTKTWIGKCAYVIINVCVPDKHVWCEDMLAAKTKTQNKHNFEDMFAAQTKTQNKHNFFMWHQVTTEVWAKKILSSSWGEKKKKKDKKRQKGGFASVPLRTCLQNHLRWNWNTHFPLNIWHHFHTHTHPQKKKKIWGNDINTVLVIKISPFLHFNVMMVRSNTLLQKIRGTNFWHKIFQSGKNIRHFGCCQGKLQQVTIHGS